MATFLKIAMQFEHRIPI